MKTLKIILLFVVLITTKISIAQTQDTLTAYPNPFSCLLTIKFEVPQDDTITLEVYNIIGQVEASLYKNLPLKKGSYTYVWRADTVADGVYNLNYQCGSSYTFKRKIVKNGNCETAAINTVKETEFIIYPNPTTGILIIPLNGTKQITITDLTGKLLKQQTTTAEQISIADIPSGSYIVNVVLVDDKKVTVQKVIKIN